MKYKDTVSKIKTDEKFKENLIENLEEMEFKKKNKGGLFIMKLKKIVITIVALLGALVGSGAVYAALGGTINGVSILEWMGIKFSEENYEEYVEPVENQVTENDEFKIALESTVCDDGFTILQFRVNLSDEMVEEYSVDDEVVFCYLSFNDPVVEDEEGYSYTDLGGANYNLIVDGEDTWVRGYSAQQIEAVTRSEFIVYQMWFLDENVLDGKEDFTITLNDIVLGLGNDAIAVDGSFEVELSKSKTGADTTSYEISKNNTIEYGKLTISLDKITCTPLQNILTLSLIYNDVDIDDLTYLLDDDYIGTISYVAYNQNENNISAFEANVVSTIEYEDGAVETGTPGEFEWSRDDFEHATYEVTVKVAIEAGSSITGINLRAYEIEDDPYSTGPSYVKAVGEFTVDLDIMEVETKDRNGEYIFDGFENDVTDEFKVFLKTWYYEDYEDFYEDWNSNYSDEDDEIGDLINFDDVDYIEISVIDDDSDELEYTDYLRSDDEEIISSILENVNDSTYYTEEFEEKYGVGGFFEGSPILKVTFKDGSEWKIIATDGMKADEDSEEENVFAFLEGDYDETTDIYLGVGLQYCLEYYYDLLSE